MTNTQPTGLLLKVLPWQTYEFRNTTQGSCHFVICLIYT